MEEGYGSGVHGRLPGTGDTWESQAEEQFAR